MPHNILVADDSQTIQKVISITLAGDDFQLNPCLSEEGLLEKITSNEKYDLILLDFNLSNKSSGYQTLKAIKEARPNVPILVMLGTFDQVEDELLEEFGSSESVIKPFDSGEFLEVCYKLLGKEVGRSIKDAPDLIVPSSSKTMVEELQSWGMEVPGALNNIEPSNAVTNLFPPVMQDIDANKLGENFDSQFEKVEENEDLEGFEMKNLVKLDENLENDLSAEVPKDINNESFWESSDSGDLEEGLEEDPISSTDFDITYGENFGLENTKEDKQDREDKEEIIVASDDASRKESTSKLDLNDVDLHHLIKQAVREVCEEKITEIAWEIIPDLAENIIRKEISALTQDLK